MSSLHFPALPSPPSPEELTRFECPPTLFVFDFDGTLVDIAPTPDLVHFDPRVPHWLSQLYDAGPNGSRVMLCSGRSLRDLERYAPDGMDLIGSHGLEWRRGFAHEPWVAPEWWDWRKQMEPELRALIAEEGGSLEDKGVSLTVHFRSARHFWDTPEAEIVLRRLAGSTVNVLPGKLVWNLVARGQAPGMVEPEIMSKGESLVRYARAVGYSRVVYFGDEPTDETVFERDELEILGVKVGGGETAARFRVENVSEVHAWLSKLVDTWNAARGEWGVRRARG